MKRILLLAGLLIGGAATLAGCYDAAEAGVMNPDEKYECVCGRTVFVPDGSPAPKCHGEMTHIGRQPSRP